MCNWNPDIGFADTESEDVDDELLVDWKGVKNGGSPFVQQKLPFKHVKRRDEPKKTTASLYPKSTGQTATSAHQILPPKQQVANLSAHVVSLSDSEPSEEVYLTNRELNHNPPQQLQGLFWLLTICLCAMKHLCVIQVFNIVNQDCQRSSKCTCKQWNLLSVYSMWSV